MSQKTQSRGRIKCYHYGKEGYIKRNCKAFKKEHKEKKKKKGANDQTTITTLPDEDFVMLSCEKDKCNVVNPYIEQVINSTASYHVIPNKKCFTSYKVEDFGKTKMGNQSYINIMGVRDVCVQSNVVYTLTLRNM